MLTLRLLWDGAQPVQVDAVLAADAGRAAPEGMQRDRSDDKRQFKEQLGCPRNIHTNLWRQETAGKLLVFSQSRGADISPEHCLELSRREFWQQDAKEDANAPAQALVLQMRGNTATGRAHNGATGRSQDPTQVTSPKNLCTSPKQVQ